ncbi:hypothetical protein PoMZ_02568, partial [Pyricularia oryzae]
HLKRFKAELVPFKNGPYSDIYITLLKALYYGNNTYNILLIADQNIVYKVFKQRCHSSNQLRNHKYILLCNNSRNIRLPSGFTFQDFLPSRPRSNSIPKRRAMAIDLVSHPAPCGKPNLAGTALRTGALSIFKAMAGKDITALRIRWQRASWHFGVFKIRGSSRHGVRKAKKP